MRLQFIVCCAAVLFCSTLGSGSRVDYKGHLVVRTTPTTAEQVQFLKNLDAAQDSSFDFWSHPRGVGFPVDIHVAPENYRKLAKLLWSMQIRHKVKTSDLQSEISKERQLIANRKQQHKSNKAFDFSNYHPYETITAFLGDLASNNSLVNVSSAGTTLQGRDIWMVVVGTGSSSDKPIIQMDCSIHAREWIAAASCLWFINQLATGYGVDADVTSLLDAYDWAIIPVANPDGYTYTWTSDRLWRKNRAPTNGLCTGVDPNRNFDADFGGTGSSDNSCSETYHGPAPFSERESAAIRDALQANAPRVRASLSIHSYSQLWMSAFSYKRDLPPEYEELLGVMKTSVDALQSTYGTEYQYGNGADTIYVCAGTTVDYAYETVGIVHSYTIELRDTGISGFLLPPTEIRPTATETWNGIKAMAFALLQLKH